MTRLAALADAIRARGFAHARAPEMRTILAEHGSLHDWPALAASWDDLGPDTYMADGGRYRKRRHAVLAAAPGAEPRWMPPQPHYQSRDYNPLNGGIARWFEPVRPAVIANAALATILRAERALADTLTPGVASWHIELHQFRIEARLGTPGRPTPEGRHRDGVDHVLVLLAARENVREGVTEVSSPDGTPLGNFTLAEPLEAALVDDLRVLHGVTPIAPEDPSRPGHRDVLVVTFRAAPA